MGGVKILKASAGSGKTYSLAYEYICNVIREPMLYRHILAVTFTNKATEEMKQRIVKELNLIASGQPSPYMDWLKRDTSMGESAIRSQAMLARTRILHDYSRFAVLTIDKFFQRIIRSFIKELGIDINFNLELQTEGLLGSAADSLLEEIILNGELKRWIVDFVDEKIEEGKAWDVKRDLTDLGREVFKEEYKSVNTAGTKKELQKIVSSAVADAAKIKALMVGDAVKALDIMHENGLEPSSFSGGSRSFANYFVKVAGGDIGDYPMGVRNALESDEKWTTAKSPDRDKILSLIPQLKPLLQNICTIYDRSIRYLNSVALLKENYRNFALLSDLSEKIREQCSASSIMPISETNTILNRLVAGNDTPFIFERAGNHFSHFMIDEFQDTSTMQWQNFIPLLKNATSQSPDAPVLLVGDIKQSIYRWRGGDWKILARDIRRVFGEEQVEERNLDTNFRSKKNVVEFNNDIIEACVAQDNATMNNTLAEATEAGSITQEFSNSMTDMLAGAYEGHRQKPKSDKAEGYITITQYARTDQNGEAVDPPVIERVEQLQRQGYKAGDIAVLVRYKKDGVRIANMLLDHKSKHPESPYTYDVVTQEALTIGHAPVVGFIIAVLKLSFLAGDAVSRAIYNRWLGKTVETPLSDDELSFIGSLELMQPLDAFEQIVIRYSLNSRPNDIAYIQALHEQIITFSTSKISDLPLFVAWWEENGAAESINMPDNNSAITIITVHKSKGLQYKAVIIPYCDWSLNPNTNSVLWAGCDDTPFGDLHRIPVGYKKAVGASFFAEDYYNEMVLSHIDNINTFYVASTRAEEELHIMMPMVARRNGGSISDLIIGGISADETVAKAGGMEGRVARSDEAMTVYEFGEPVENTATQTIHPHITARFESRRSNMQVKLRLQSQRYFEEGGSDASLSPRSFGMLMHKVFENASSESDIAKALSGMLSSGSISATEHDNLKNMIADAFTNPVIRSWFDGRWATVRNENDIIIPRTTQVRRPDRVMLGGIEAVIVDYKFGLQRSPAHRRQIGEYADLLKSMGYQKVEGYIWYVTINDIEAVNT